MLSADLKMQPTEMPVGQLGGGANSKDAKSMHLWPENTLSASWVAQKPRFANGPSVAEGLDTIVKPGLEGDAALKSIKPLFSFCSRKFSSAGLPKPDH
jgi:hypothetical protein